MPLNCAFRSPLATSASRLLREIADIQLTDKSLSKARANARSVLPVLRRLFPRAWTRALPLIYFRESRLTHPRFASKSSYHSVNRERLSLSTATKRGRKGEETRLQILEVAERDFAELGYDATKLEAIGDSIGIKRAAIFYHFRSKRELFEDVFSEIHGSLVSYTEERLVGATDPWERLLLLVESWVDFMVARPTAARLILRNCANAEHPDDYSPEFSRNALQLLREIIAEGAKSGKFAANTSMHLVNLLSGSILHYVCNPQQLGDDRPYRPDDPAEVALFKSILRKTARAIVEPTPVPASDR